MTARRTPVSGSSISSTSGVDRALVLDLAQRARGRRLTHLGSSLPRTGISRSFQRGSALRPMPRTRAESQSRRREAAPRARAHVSTSLKKPSAASAAPRTRGACAGSCDDSSSSRVSTRAVVVGVEVFQLGRAA